MSALLFLPVRLLGLAAAGFALGVGWKLGSHLVGVAMGEKDLLWPKSEGLARTEGDPKDVLMRRFAGPSED